MEKIFSILDTKVGTYGPVMQFKNSLQATRHFSDIVNGRFGDGDIVRHPGDYTLFEVGEVDVDTAEIKPQAKIQLACGVDLKDNKENLQ